MHMIAVTAIGVVLFAQAICQAAIGFEDTTLPNYWNTRSIVYARVKQVTRNQETRKLTVQLRPSATLAGSFDPSQLQDLVVEVVVSPLSSSVPTTPLADTNVVALIHNRNGAYSITSKVAKFFPNGCPILVVKDLSDKRIEELIEAVRKERGTPVPENGRRGQPNKDYDPDY